MEEFNLPKLEEEVLKNWDERDIFKKTLEKTKRGKPFVFYEGPPYANGRPGIHHVLARVVKDVMLRYKTMRGFYVPRRAGWDTHGLPVEIAAEKALGLKTKRDIEKFGVKRFNEETRKQVWIYKDEWERLTRRIGYWVDLRNAYVTYEPEYMETLWWILKKIWQRGFLYKGRKVAPWCTRCGTTLSSHELAQEGAYKEVADNSVFIKFKLKNGQRVGNFVADDATYVLSWTTTPWTLPGNVALAVGEDIEYSFVRTTAPDRASYIVAKKLAESVLKESDFAVLGEIPGRRLIGLEYEPLFDLKIFRDDPNAFKIYPASFVTTEDGTGVVHTAVMYGEDDYELGKKYGLPERHTVNDEGKFTEDVPGLAGSYVKAAETEEKIFEHLRRRGNLLRVERYLHEYPHCWRCGTPILYYARTSWFIAMSRLRAELLKSNKKINWMPAHVKNGRFGEWLREAKDWNLSRERFWSTPLPVWECAKCGKMEVIGGLDELSQLAGGTKNKYWIMRHGEAKNNVLHVMDDGELEFHLTKNGRKTVEQSAHAFRKQLDKNKKKMDMIFSSPILRTVETAGIAAKALGVGDVIRDERLREFNPGKMFEGVSMQEFHSVHPFSESRFENGPGSVKAEGGESWSDVRKRVWDFVSDCEKKYEGKNILIVSHGDPLFLLSQAALGISDKALVRMSGKFYPVRGKVCELPIKIIPRDDTGGVDLHRPFADAVEIKCRECNSNMKRVPEVADVWYDSGAMPLGKEHFPFGEIGSANAFDDSAAAKSVKQEKNSAKNQPKPEGLIPYPADYIAEGMDQTRGWFYTLLAIATALGYEAPYKNVITFGLINDKFGHKMSKSKGNIVEPFSVIDKYGVDAVRWHFYTSMPLGESRNFDELEVAKTMRKTHLILWNSLVFLKTYSDGNNFSAKLSKSKNVLDRWIMALLNDLIVSVSAHLDAYEIREAALKIDAFVDDLSRWYIRRSRRRFQRPSGAADLKAASATLGYALFAVTKMMAPFTPFFSEKLYRELGGRKESVHLEDWPAVEGRAGRTNGARGGSSRGAGTRMTSTAKLMEEMAQVREFAASGLAKRAEAGIKVRQPLASLTIPVRLSGELAAVLAEEVNVKKILTAKQSVVSLDTAITPELRSEGIVREIARMIQELRQRAGLQPKDKITLMISADRGVNAAVSGSEKRLLADVGAKSITYARSDKFLAEEESKIDGAVVWISIRKYSGRK